jgi:uncharacterized membrane protein YfcA
METSIDTTLLVASFLAATFAAALVAGLAGFAFGLIAAAVWLYILTPLQTATLIIWFGLIVQGYAVWKLRRAIRWKRIAPLVIGAAIGVPLGAYALVTASPRALRLAVGVSAYLLAHDVLHFAPLEIGRDAVIMAGVIAIGFTAATLIEKK